GARIFISGAAAAAEAEADCGGRWRIGEQSQGEILQAYGEGPDKVICRDFQMAAALGSNRPHTRSGGGIPVMTWWKRRADRLDDEIHKHIDFETQENIDAGMSSAEARYAALKKFGNAGL